MSDVYNTVERLMRGESVKLILTSDSLAEMLDEYQRLNPEQGLMDCLNDLMNDLKVEPEELAKVVDSHLLTRLHDDAANRNLLKHKPKTNKVSSLFGVMNAD